MTVQLLLEELEQVGDWYSFGVALGVPVNKLRELQASDHQGGVSRWKIDTLQYWLDTTPTASWADITRALEQRGHLKLAARLKSKYGVLGQEPTPSSGAEGVLYIK